MKYLNAFIMCQSMFCVLPGPWKRWDEDSRPYMLMFLPLIGLEIGVIWMGLAWVMSCFALPQIQTAAVLCLYPFFVTGFLHLDGFMDVTDAVRSYRDLDRRREILKDSHVGAFAVVGCISLMILQFATFASFSAGDMRAGAVLAVIPVISRCCSALAVTALPPMTTSQYAACEMKKSHCAVMAAVLVCVAAAGFIICGRYGFASLGCMVGYGIALHRAYRSLKGMNGDVSGYALTIGELCGVMLLALL